MKEAFRALLTSAAAVTALAPAARINFGVHPQGAAYPAIVLNVIDDGGAHTLDGKPDSLSRARMQVDCYGLTYAAASGLAKVVRDTLDGHLGGTFKGMFLDGERDMGRETAGDQPFRTSLDFLALYMRA